MSDGRRGTDYRGKRALDVTLVVLAAVIALPVGLVLAVLVRVTSRGPALHRARRVGREGEPFTLYKFRSMRTDAATTGPGITAGDDARITPVGRLIRRTKLDELPQLWNVLRGDMSIVGPRPEDPRYVEWYSDEQRAILQWRPGITSPASVTYRDEEALLAGSSDLDAAYRSVMADKLALDLAYFPNSSLTGDLRWIVRTVAAVVGR